MGKASTATSEGEYSACLVESSNDQTRVREGKKTMVCMVAYIASNSKIINE
jgi:hypothetical protein